MLTIIFADISALILFEQLGPRIFILFVYLRKSFECLFAISDYFPSIKIIRNLIKIDEICLFRVNNKELDVIRGELF